MANTPNVRFKGFADDWEQRKLGELSSSFEYGLNVAAKEYDGKNKYIRITDIDDSSHEFLTDEVTSPDTELSIADNYKLSIGDILFARTGASVGKTYIYKDSDGLVYYAGFLIRARIKKEYNPEFVFQNTLTTDYEKYIAVTSQRSGQPGVNAQEYSEYKIMVPSKAEQDKISTYLRSLDHLITLHQHKCDEARELKKYMLQKMFPQNRKKIPEIRFEGFTDDWEQRKLGDMMFFSNGFNGSNESFGSGIALISVMDILNNDFITYETIRGKAKVSNIELERFKVEYGDVLFQRSSENVEDAGTSNVYLDTEKIAIFGGFVIRGKRKVNYDPVFIKYLLDSSPVRKQIVRKAQGAQHVNVSQEILQDIDILYPLSGEDVKIGNLLRSLDGVITLYQRKCDELKQVKKFMLKNMFPQKG